MFKLLVLQAFRKKLEALFGEFVDKISFDEEQQRKILINALTTIYLFDKYSLVSAFGPDEGNALCQALLPGMHGEKLQFHVDTIKEALPSTYW